MSPPNFHSIKYLKQLLLATSLVALTACGGGGGGGGGGDDDDDTPPVATNKNPTVSISSDSSVTEGGELVLQATATDSDGTIASYAWQQTSGPDLTLTGSDTSTLTITAPEIEDDADVVVSLTVTDDDGATATATVTIELKRKVLSVTITGIVTDEPIINSSIVVQIGDEQFEITADAQGRYSVNIEVDDSDADELVKLVALGNNSIDPGVEFVSQLKSIATLVSQAGADGTLSKDENFGVNITNVSTAEFALLSRDGTNIDSEQALDEALLAVDADEKLLLAALIKIIVDNDDYELPEGVDSTLDLISSAEQIDDFINTVESQDPGLIDSTKEEIKDDELKWLLPKLENVDEHTKDLLQRFTHRLLRRISNPTIDGIKNIAQNIHEQDNPINTAKKILDIEGVDIFVPKKKIIVGTRGSKLALTQTNWVIDQLKKIETDYEFEIKIIRTSGDDGNIDVVGAFTSALQRSMLAGEIDLAVHSFKDIPTEGVVGLRIVPVTPRKDVRDVLISKSGKKLVDLPSGAVVGTGSLRRSAQLQQIRPDLEYKFIQGNVDGRIHKMETEGYDAIVLAATGLQKMNMIDIATEIFETDVMVPAVGQGILSIELIDKEGHIVDLVKQLRHEPTKDAADAERAFLIALGGGCNMPIAAYAQATETEITIEGVYATEDGKHFEKGIVTGNIADKKTLARDLALELKAKIELKEKVVLSNVAT